MGYPIVGKDATYEEALQAGTKRLVQLFASSPEVAAEIRAESVGKETMAKIKLMTVQSELMLANAGFELQLNEQQLALGALKIDQMQLDMMLLASEQASANDPVLVGARNAYAELQLAYGKDSDIFTTQGGFKRALGNPAFLRAWNTYYDWKASMTEEDTAWSSMKINRGDWNFVNKFFPSFTTSGFLGFKKRVFVAQPGAGESPIAGVAGQGTAPQLSEGGQQFSDLVNP